MAGFDPTPPSAATGLDDPVLPPKKTSTLAVAGMITSLVGVFTCCAIVPSLVGTVLSAAALPRTGPTGTHRGRGFAWAGVISGGLGLLLGGAAWVFVTQVSDDLIRGAALTAEDRAALVELGALHPDEQVDILYKDWFSLEDGVRLVTDERLVHLDEQGNVMACELEDIAAIDFAPGDTLGEGAFIIVTEDVETLWFSVDSTTGQDQTFFAVLRNAVARAREDAGRDPADITAPASPGTP